MHFEEWNDASAPAGVACNQGVTTMLVTSSGKNIHKSCDIVGLLQKLK